MLYAAYKYVYYLCCQITKLKSRPFGCEKQGLERRVKSTRFNWFCKVFDNNPNSNILLTLSRQPYLITVSQKRLIRINNLSKPKQSITLGGHKDSNITSICLINESTIASGDLNGLIKLWDFERIISGAEKHNKLLWDYFDSDSDPETAIISEFCVEDEILMIQNLEDEKCDILGGVSLKRGGTSVVMDVSIEKDKGGFLVVLKNGRVVEFVRE